MSLHQSDTDSTSVGEPMRSRNDILLSNCLKVELKSAIAMATAA